jgi:hypothetical protein
LPVNDYASEQKPFAIINNTLTNLDQILGNLIVNNALNPQPITVIKEPGQLLNKNGGLSGLIFNEWSSTQTNDLTLLYNDSALFSLPYLINTLSNLYSKIDKTSLINTTISAWPKTQDQTIQSFDASSFSALIILGTGLILPLVSFATEIVHDREYIKFINFL